MILFAVGFLVIILRVVQVASVRDISRSSMADGGRSSSNRRLLKIVLTDGQSELSAIEYCPIPTISDNVVPGTKVVCSASLLCWVFLLIEFAFVCLSNYSGALH